MLQQEYCFMRVEAEVMRSPALNPVFPILWDMAL